MKAPSLREWKGRVGQELRWPLMGLSRFMTRPYAKEVELLEAYRGLVRQAYYAEFFQPWLCTDVFWKGAWCSPDRVPPTRSPARRERDNAVHHYGHDVLFKRYAGMPLVGRPLPFLLEHGVNFSDRSAFEVPDSWVRSYLCMGERRAELLRRNHGVAAHALGPYIRYARSPLSQQRFDQIKQRLGRTLLVIPTHSTAQIRRIWSHEEWIALVERHRRDQGYSSVLWMGFWKDPLPLDALPPGWIPAGNGHASNPWFLDCQRLLFELSDAVCSCALGTHIGYALELGLPVLFGRQPLIQDTSRTDELWRDRFHGELQERERLIDHLLADAGSGPLPLLNSDSARRLLEPWFGFSQRVSSKRMRAILLG
jgi:hypothetical protein